MVLAENRCKGCVVATGGLERQHLHTQLLKAILGTSVPVDSLE